MTVMAGHSRPKDGVLSHAYVLAIHVLRRANLKTWMPATSAGMTLKGLCQNQIRPKENPGFAWQSRGYFPSMVCSLNRRP
jgi:hypothetical protein